MNARGLFAVLALSGCSPVIDAFSVQPAEVCPNSVVQASWRTHGDVNTTLDIVPGAPHVQVSSPNDGVTVFVGSQSLDFNLSANAFGASVTATRHVTVVTGAVNGAISGPATCSNGMMTIHGQYLGTHAPGLTVTAVTPPAGRNGTISHGPTVVYPGDLSALNGMPIDGEWTYTYQLLGNEVCADPLCLAGGGPNCNNPPPNVAPLLPLGVTAGCPAPATPPSNNGAGIAGSIMQEGCGAVGQHCCVYGAPCAGSLTCYSGQCVTNSGTATYSGVRCNGMPADMNTQLVGVGIQDSNECLTNVVYVLADSTSEAEDCVHATFGPATTVTDGSVITKSFLLTSTFGTSCITVNAADDASAQHCAQNQCINCSVRETESCP